MLVSFNLLSQKMFTSLAIRGKNRWTESLWKKKLIRFPDMGHFSCNYRYMTCCRLKNLSELNFWLSIAPPAVTISVVGALRISTQLARPTKSLYNTGTKATHAPGILKFDIQTKFLRDYYYGLPSLQVIWAGWFGYTMLTHCNISAKAHILAILAELTLSIHLRGTSCTSWGRQSYFEEGIFLNAKWQYWLDRQGRLWKL